MYHYIRLVVILFFCYCYLHYKAAFEWHDIKSYTLNVTEDETNKCRADAAQLKSLDEEIGSVNKNSSFFFRAKC